jgi:hypothetical protein
MALPWETVCTDRTLTKESNGECVRESRSQIPLVKDGRTAAMAQIRVIQREICDRFSLWSLLNEICENGFVSRAGADRTHPNHGRGDPKERCWQQSSWDQAIRCPNCINILIYIAP